MEWKTLLFQALILVVNLGVITWIIKHGLEWLANRKVISHVLAERIATFAVRAVENWASAKGVKDGKQKFEKAVR